MPQTKAVNGKTQTPIRKATSKTTRASTASQNDVSVANKELQRVATRNDIAADTGKAKKYLAMKTLTYNGAVYTQGQEVVGAANWLRLETWIANRWIEEKD